MSKFKFRGFIPAVNKYIKSKSPVEILAEVIAFGVLLPMVIIGLTTIIFAMLTGEIDTNNLTFGIYGQWINNVTRGWIILTRTVLNRNIRMKEIIKVIVEFMFVLLIFYTLYVSLWIFCPC